MATALRLLSGCSLSSRSATGVSVALLHQAHVEGLPHSTLPGDFDLHHLAGLPEADHLLQLGHVIHRLAVDRDDHVALLEAAPSPPVRPRCPGSPGPARPESHPVRRTRRRSGSRPRPGYPGPRGAPYPK